MFSFIFKARPSEIKHPLRVKSKSFDERLNTCSGCNKRLYAGTTTFCNNDFYYCSESCSWKYTSV